MCIRDRVRRGGLGPGPAGGEAGKGLGAPGNKARRAGARRPPVLPGATRGPPRPVRKHRPTPPGLPGPSRPHTRGWGGRLGLGRVLGGLPTSGRFWGVGRGDPRLRACPGARPGQRGWCGGSEPGPGVGFSGSRAWAGEAEQQLGGLRRESNSRGLGAQRGSQGVSQLKGRLTCPAWGLGDRVGWSDPG